MLYKSNCNYNHNYISFIKITNIEVLLPYVALQWNNLHSTDDLMT